MKRVAAQLFGLGLHDAIQLVGVAQRVVQYLLNLLVFVARNGLGADRFARQAVN